MIVDYIFNLFKLDVKCNINHKMIKIVLWLLRWFVCWFSLEQFHYCIKRVGCIHLLLFIVSIKICLKGLENSYFHK